MVGRISELADLEEAVRTRRLVTLSGPGGCGKTRLAGEVAHALAAEFDQISWTELDTLEAGVTIDEAVAAAVGPVRRHQGPILELVAAELSGKRALLVLDNCEHVIDSAAAVTETLLAACPGLTILTTSREHLLLTGEYTLAVPPLQSASPLELTRSEFEKPSEAAVMFMDRAGMDPASRDQLSTIEAVCAQLDGMPLAIELAAPLLSTMTMDDLADGLLDRFRLLADHRRGSRPQHRSMRAVVEWSYDLLEQDERDTFAALSVFRGSFTMAAAVRVAGAVDVDAATTVPRLVRKSMVLEPTKRAGPARYRLLETLREFGAESLRAMGKVTDVKREFLNYFAWLALWWGKKQQSVMVAAWSAEFGPDIPNFQAALPMAREADVDTALRLIDAFQWYFASIGQLAETRAWLRRTVAECELTLEQRAMAHVSQAALANFAGDYGVTAELGEDALAAARELGDPRRINAALIMRGTTAAFEGNTVRAAECLIESSELSEELGDLSGIAVSNAFWGIAHRREGDFDKAQRCFDVAFEAFTRLADDRGVALIIGNLGRMAQQQGDLERADELTRRALDIATQTGHPIVCAQVGLFAGHTQLELGNHGQAMADFEFSLRHSLALENRAMGSAAIEWMVMLGGAGPREVALIDAFTRVHRSSPGT
ncbi:MAG: tetratricopeptide repeat protein, partial [Acidimicrobiales bacterium]